MKPALKSICPMLAVAFFVSFCSQQEESADMNGDKTFPTPEEAVAKAKSDLLEALETQKDLNLGVDAAQLRQAQPARHIRYAEVDFAKILAADSIASLADIVAADKSMVAPFVLAGQVVAIVEIGKVSDGWKVVGLANKAITDDLNQTGLLRRGEAAVTLYEVPNLQLAIYGARDEGGEFYHLNFEQFKLQERAAISAFYPIVREHALRFQERFGEELKRGKLVK